MKRLVAIKLRSSTLELLAAVGNENEGFESIINRLVKTWNQK